jgi:hypothetical protein
LLSAPRPSWRKSGILELQSPAVRSWDVS